MDKDIEKTESTEEAKSSDETSSKKSFDRPKVKMPESDEGRINIDFMEKYTVSPMYVGIGAGIHDATGTSVIRKYISTAGLLPHSRQAIYVPKKSKPIESKSKSETDCVCPPEAQASQMQTV